MAPRGRRPRLLSPRPSARAGAQRARPAVAPARRPLRRTPRRPARTARAAALSRQHRDDHSAPPPRRALRSRSTRTRVARALARRSAAAPRRRAVAARPSAPPARPSPRALLLALSSSSSSTAAAPPPAAPPPAAPRASARRARPTAQPRQPLLRVHRQVQHRVHRRLVRPVRRREQRRRAADRPAGAPSRPGGLGHARGVVAVRRMACARRGAARRAAAGGRVPRAECDACASRTVRTTARLRALNAACVDGDQRTTEGRTASGVRGGEHGEGGERARDRLLGHRRQVDRVRHHVERHGLLLLLLRRPVVVVATTAAARTAARATQRVRQRLLQRLLQREQRDTSVASVALPPRAWCAVAPRARRGGPRASPCRSTALRTRARGGGHARVVRGGQRLGARRPPRLRGRAERAVRAVQAERVARGAVAARARAHRAQPARREYATRPSAGTSVTSSRKRGVVALAARWVRPSICTRPPPPTAARARCCTAAPEPRSPPVSCSDSPAPPARERTATDRSPAAKGRPAVARARALHRVRPAALAAHEPSRAAGDLGHVGVAKGVQHAVDGVHLQHALLGVGEAEVGEVGVHVAHALVRLRHLRLRVRGVRRLVVRRVVVVVVVGRRLGEQVEVPSRAASLDIDAGGGARARCWAATDRRTRRSAPPRRGWRAGRAPGGGKGGGGGGGHRTTRTTRPTRRRRRRPPPPRRRRRPRLGRRGAAEEQRRRAAQHAVERRLAGRGDEEDDARAVAQLLPRQPDRGVQLEAREHAEEDALRRHRAAPRPAERARHLVVQPPLLHGQRRAAQVEVHVAQRELPADVQALLLEVEGRHLHQVGAAVQAGAQLGAGGKGRARRAEHVEAARQVEEVRRVAHDGGRRVQHARASTRRGPRAHARCIDRRRRRGGTASHTTSGGAPPPRSRRSSSSIVPRCRRDAYDTYATRPSSSVASAAPTTRISSRLCACRRALAVTRRRASRGARRATRRWCRR